MKKLGRMLLALAAAGMTAASAYALDATVVSTSGKVEVQQGSAWVPVKAGDTIKKGAVISTGFKSEAELNVDGSTIKLGALTRVTVEQLVSSGQKNEAALYLDSGKVEANVRHSDGKKVGFTVSSPVATASVRGTAFSMNARGDLVTTEGLVSKAPAVARSAQVAGDEPSAFVPADGESSVFTSTADVGGSFGVPVFAGQSSSTDAVTGRPVPPQTERARGAAGLGKGTATQASREGQAPAAAGAESQLAPPPPAAQGSTGTLVVIITLPSADSASSSTADAK